MSTTTRRKAATTDYVVRNGSSANRSNPKWISAVERPRRRATIWFQAMPDGSAVVVDPTTWRAYALNRTASEVWQLCDGSRLESEIATSLRGRYSGRSDELQSVLAMLLAEFRGLGIVER